MYWWDQSEYMIGDIKVRDTPDEPKYTNILRDTRTLQEKLEAFEAEFKKEEPLVIRG